MKKIAFFNLIFVLVFSAQAQFVQITNCDNSINQNVFSVNGIFYKPLVCNYSIEFLQDPSNNWYISPSRQYTRNWTSNGTLEFDISNPNNSVVIAKNKIVSDLNRIKSLGFTEIRLIGATLLNTGTNAAPYYNYKTGNNQTYFNLLNYFFNQAQNAGLKVILLMGAGAEYYGSNSNFKQFLRDNANNFKNNTTLMAYDLFNEPSNLLWENKQTDKYNSAKLLNEWNSCIKKIDQNHLTTIGLNDLGQIDPTLLNVDFISYHFYLNQSDYVNYGTLPLSSANNNNTLNTYLYYCGKNINRPWIIGETGYGANNTPVAGNPNIDPSANPEQNQKEYASYTLQKSLNCNCKGYSWWQYQDVQWGNAADAYTGLYQSYFNFSEGVPKPIAYPTTHTNPSPFLAYSGLSQNTSNCGMPTNYYSVLNGTTIYCKGYLKDQLGNPISNAMVNGLLDDWSTQFVTFTDGNGYFEIKTKGTGSIGKLSFSKYGYSNLVVASPASIPVTPTYIIKKINNNSWSKEWTNEQDPSNQLKIVNDNSNNWVLSDYDKFYKGDFNGDGQEDLFCVKYTNNTSTTDRMSILTYTQSFTQTPHNGDYVYGFNAGWKILWDKKTVNSTNEGIYPYRNNLVVGDFNGDGKDDVISLNGTSTWSAWFSFVSNANPLNAYWKWEDSNYGQTSGNSMSMMINYNSSVIVGDFYGVGRDAILGISNGTWMTTFLLVGNNWTWVQSNLGATNNPSPGYELSYLTPYKQQLLSGDFDGDGQTDLFGNELPSGSMALFKVTWDNSSAAFKWVNSNNQPYWKDNNNSYGLFQYRDRILVGNFDKDKNDELFCLNNTHCVVFDFFNFTQNNCSGSWDGADYTSISDHEINGSLPTTYVFLKNDPDKPNNQQELLAIRKSNLNPTQYIADIYNFRPNPESYWPCSTLRTYRNTISDETLNNNNNSSKININSDELIIFPNPSNGKFYLKFDQIPFDSGSDRKIKIFDSQGKEIQNFNAVSFPDSKIIEININAVSGIYLLQYQYDNRILSKKFHLTN